MGKVKLFLPSSICLFLDLFLLQKGTVTSPLDSWTLKKLFSSVGGCQNHCFYGEIGAENSYSTILLISLHMINTSSLLLFACSLQEKKEWGRRD